MTDHFLPDYAHMCNYSAEDRTPGEVMQDPETQKTENTEPANPAGRGCIDENTCACGEKHQNHAGHGSHRESCTSPLKFGNSCCCQPGEDPHPVHHRCGHGPRCQDDNIPEKL
jgi:hypothetical protein